MSYAVSAPVPRAREAEPPFAAIEVCADLASARAAFEALQGFGGAYQSYDFARSYAAAFGARVAAVVARDASGEPLALLALELRRWGPLTSAAMIGGAWANYHMGLFRPGISWSAADVAALLRAAGAQAGIDVFAFASLPAQAANPLALLPGVASPSPAFATALGRDPALWLDAHFSRATQKKLRKKARKLEALGPMRHVRASGGEAQPLLAAFYAHKAAQAAARGERDLFAEPEVRALLAGLVASGAMEMHALMAGERVAATLGALPGGRRLSGLVISYDGAPEIAVASPGEWLVVEVVRDAMARGFDTLDLGVGDSRYKRETCEIEEVLRDAALGVTPLGRLAAGAYLGARVAKGWIKRRPKLLALAKRLRG